MWWEGVCNQTYAQSVLIRRAAELVTTPACGASEVWMANYLRENPQARSERITIELISITGAIIYSQANVIFKSSKYGHSTGLAVFSADNPEGTSTHHPFVVSERPKGFDSNRMVLRLLRPAFLPLDLPNIAKIIEPTENIDHVYLSVAGQDRNLARKLRELSQGFQNGEISFGGYWIQKHWLQQKLDYAIQQHEQGEDTNWFDDWLQERIAQDQERINKYPSLADVYESATDKFTRTKTNTKTIVNSFLATLT